MKRTSPPTGVTASPVATPGSAVRFRTSAAKRRGPSHTRTRLSPTARRFARPSAISRAAFAEERCELPLEVADAGLPRVLADDDADRRVADRHPRLREPVRLELLRHEVPLRDRELLLLGVAGQVQHVHPVEQ